MSLFCHKSHHSYLMCNKEQSKEEPNYFYFFFSVSFITLVFFFLLHHNTTNSWRIGEHNCSIDTNLQRFKNRMHVHSHFVLLIFEVFAGLPSRWHCSLSLKSITDDKEQLCEGAFLHLLALAVESAVFYLVHFKEYKSTKYTKITAQMFTFIHFEKHGQN